MERLEYIVDDKTIAELLGVQNFTNKESAILELVKNSYDAESKKLDIIFSDSELIIQDDGIGMSEEDIKKNWMYVGKSSKGYMSKNKRILSGSKGIGRFALARLGSEVEILSKKEESIGIKWITDWEESLLEKIDLQNKGTRLTIKNLREKWNLKSIELLKNYLSRAYNDNAMEINIKYDEKNYFVDKYFDTPKLGYNCLSKILLNYDSGEMKLKVKIKSDEFEEEAYEYYKDGSLFERNIEVNMYEEIGKKIEKFYGYSSEETIDILKEIGDFKGELYFSLNGGTKEEKDKFLYKYKNLPEIYKEGVILYRNAFSISSFDGTKDWLELSKRSRKSPAAATHPTGAWRVRENNISGKIEIDKQKNKYLRDLSNRQGFEESPHYEVFIDIIQIGISEFESYRQNIIRNINKKNKEKVNQENMILELIKKDYKIANKLTDKDSKELSEALKNAEKEEKKKEKEFKEKEIRYMYDVRILNVLATSGLKSTSIAHELKNDRNHVKNFYRFMQLAMKKYNIWDYVNEEERIQHPHTNIPHLLERNSRISEKIVVFLNNVLENVEKNKFIKKEHKVLEVIKYIENNWKRDYSKLEFELDIDENLNYEISEDILKVIFDNLILNTVQQNTEKTYLRVYISIKKNNEKGLFLIYRDYGKGLEKKYLNNPKKILEVHETSRDDGHGLGMWIVNNSINMCFGQIINITGENGFKIEFTLNGGK